MGGFLHRKHAVKAHYIGLGSDDAAESPLGRLEGAIDKFHLNPVAPEHRSYVTQAQRGKTENRIVMCRMKKGINKRNLNCQRKSSKIV
ncbi:MAG: hypothetical protein ACM3UY_06990 [Methanocella sp.]|jgi:hypothetical protein